MEGYVYAVGGYDSSCQLSSVERYCTATNQWEFVAPMRSPRSALSVAVINNRLYALGESNIAAAILTLESGILKILFLVFNDEFADVLLLSFPQVVTTDKNFCLQWSATIRTQTSGRK